MTAAFLSACRLRALLSGSGAVPTPSASAAKSVVFAVTAVRKLASETKKSQSIDDVQGLFAEARLLLQDANESKGSVYFSEDFEDAKIAVQDTLDAYKAIVEASPTPEARESIRNANDPKFRQLAEEFSSLEDDLIHDE
jgi:hypothetical protein